MARPKADWEARYRGWVASGMARTDYLHSIGLSGETGPTYQITKRWEERLRSDETDLALFNVAARRRDGGAEVIEVVATMVEDLGADAAAAAPAARKRRAQPEAAPAQPAQQRGDAERAAPAPEPSSWQVIQSFRRKQGIEDYRTADQVRLHVKLLLKNSIQRSVDDKGREVIETRLRPIEAKQLAQALSDVQRVQRLALGMSTENLGIDPPVEPGSNVEKDVTPSEEPIPTFVVEMSKRGKFVRPRPRRVS